MSGDVQPRRRKDKRRKKEEDDAGTPPPTLVSPSADPLAENLTIHVHKDGGTGGHWCARIVFFALFAILVGLIGIILLEHRGAADVDTPLAESRWALVFDGWVDDAKPSHDHDESVSQHDDHVEHVDEEDEKEEATEVDSQEAGQTDERADAEDEDEDEDGDEDEYDNMQEALSKENESNETDGDSDQKASDSQEEIASHEISNEDPSDEKERSEESVPREVAWNAEDDDDAENAALEEIEEGTSQEEIEATEREKDEPIAGSNENDVSIEGVDSLRYRQDDDDRPRVYEDFVGISGIPGVNDIDDNSAEPLEEFEDEEPEEIRDEVAVEPDVEEVEEESSSVAAKFGVGIALVMAAHFVLVRRWNNVENNISQVDSNRPESPDLSRRNTIIPPPCVERLIPTISDEEAQESKIIHTENYKTLRSKYEKFKVEGDGEPLIKTPGKKTSAENKDKGWEDKENEEELDSEQMLGSAENEDEDDNDDDDDNDNDDDDDDVDDDDEDEDEDDDEDDDDEDDDDDDEDDEEEEDVIDDSELVAKLEAKYGKLPVPSESEGDTDEEEEDETNDKDVQGRKRVNVPLVKQSEFAGKPQVTGKSPSGQGKTPLEQGGARAYVNDNIPDPNDAAGGQKFDTTHGQTAEERVVYFTAKLSDHPASPWARYELARALDDLAEEKKDNSYLRRAIAAYQSVGELGTRVPPSLFRVAGERCIDRFRFAGQHSGAEAVHKDLISRFPDEPHLRNQLAITYMMQNKLSEARKVLQEILARWPNDGLALAHYGFILKTGDGNMVDAIMYLKAGIDSGHEGTIDGRFFFHLGDALVRLGKTEEAKKLYQNGAERGLFRSAYQRSLYNVDRLTARPWWTLEQTNYKEFFETLEENWRVIRAEGLAVLNQNGQFKNEAENLRDKGNWQQFELFVKGRKILENCAKTPRTCSLVERFSPAASCRRGQIKFSVMHPGTHVWPHCGPTNCRLRAHLGLSGTARTFIRVADEIKTWREGSVMVFDDSFEHEVWHNGSLTRLVLIVDVWHPELRESERRTMPAI